MKNFFQYLRLLFLLPEKAVVFKADSSYSFPVHEISAIKQEQKIIITTALFSLIGYCGVLPDPIKTLVLSQENKKDFVLSDFLNIFHNGFIHLLYEVWQSQHFLVLHERYKNDWSKQPLLSFTLGLSGEQNNKYSALLIRYHYFFLSKRSLGGFQALLQDYFECPVKAHSFLEEWVLLSDHHKTKLGLQNTVLGADMILGEKVLFEGNKFLLNIGPVSYHDYCLWQPGFERTLVLKEIVSLYVGDHLGFDVNVIVDWGSAVPLYLSGFRVLGWDSWLRSCH